MAMSERPRHGDAADVPGDPQLGRLYRESAREEPPAHLDAAILAAAHRKVDARPRSIGSSWARSWRLPVSIAAVVVLSVSVVTLMLEETDDELVPLRRKPDTVSQGVAPEKMSSPATPVEPAPPAAAPAAGSRIEAPSQAEGQRPDTTGPGERPPSVGSLPSTPAAEPVPAPAAAPDALAGVPPPSSERRIAPPQTPSAKDRLPQPAPSALRTPAAGPGEDRRQPALPARSGRAAAESAGTAAPRPTVALEKSALVTRFEDQPPDKWLEQITELRREGRSAEADELLAEFKKRFPDHPLPPALR